MSVSPQNTIRDWVETVLEIPVINEDQKDPTAPRRNKEDGVDTYAALELDSDRATTSTPFDRLDDEEIATIADENVPGGTTPASSIKVASLFGFAAGVVARIITGGGTFEREVTGIDVDNSELDFATDDIDFDIDLGDAIEAIGLVTRTISTVRVGDVPIEFYGPEAVAKARQLELEIGGDSYIETFYNLPIALMLKSEIGDEPLLRSATREPIASMLLGVQWTDSIEKPVAYAAEVAIDAVATGGSA